MKKILLSMLFALLIPFGAVAQVAYAVYENGTLTFYYDNLKNYSNYWTYWLDTGENDPGWYTDHRRDITKVIFDSSFANARPTSTYKWFAVNDPAKETSALTSIEGIEYLKTSKVTNMAWMFCGCSNLTSLDLSEFDHVIENDTTDHNYRPCAFVQRQRYTTLEKICAASFTSQLL